MVAQWVQHTSGGAWVSAFPFMEIGSTLFASGLITIAYGYIEREDGEARATARLRSVFNQEAPAIRDAVIDGLAFNVDTLKSLSSPETIDQIIRNCLAVRLGDETLAADIYTDLYTQVVRTAERRHQARTSVTLTPWEGGPDHGAGAQFVATIRWEYRVVPTEARQRFTCVSDLEEYRRLVEAGTNDVWYFEPTVGLTAASRDAFALVQFTVDGEPLRIRRSARAASQGFSVELLPEHLGREVSLSYTYRVLVQKHGHLLYLDVAQPTHGLTVELDYSHTNIRHVTALDFVASSRQPRTTYSPESTPGRSVSVSTDGWLFPKSGIAFVWVLDEEVGETR